MTLETGSALELPLARERCFRISRWAKLSLLEGKLYLKKAASDFSFVPDVKVNFLSGMLDLEHGGVIGGELDIQYREFLQSFSPGFEYHYPGEENESPFLSFSFLSSGGSGPGQLTFYLHFDPCHADERRMTLAEISGCNTMDSCFRGGAGQIVSVQVVLDKVGETAPSGVRFCPGERKGPHPTEPIGDYQFPMGVSLLCGLLGTETIELPAGGRLRFVPGQSAYAPGFPARPLEISDFVSGLPAAPLTGEVKTVWAMAPSTGCTYCSQPDGSPLFGGNGALLYHEKSATVLPAEVPFPIVPVAGLDRVPGCATQQAAAFERQILAPTRQHTLLECGLGRRNAGGEPVRTTVTPAGQLVELTETGGWASVSLAQCGADSIWFERPDAALTEALCTGSLFLVVADPTHLGESTTQTEPLGRGAFHNRIRLDEWEFTLPIGVGNQYNEYQNVMIIKGREGALYDPDGDGGLIADPTCWTCREQFSSPMVEGKRDSVQQTNLANWLIGYFAQCAQKTDDAYTASFNRLARDPAWRGILFLNVPVSKDNLPDSLVCMTMGLPAGDGLALHHLGVQLSPVEPGERGPVLKGDSSIFGLIDYQAEGFTGAPLSGGSEKLSFRTLSFRVLFENSVVKCMENQAQLQLEQVLGLTPGSGSCQYNSLMLSGGGQVRDNGSTSALRCEGEHRFCFSDGPLEEVRITSATMQTLSLAENHYRFDLSGTLVFRALETADGAIRDLFSFAQLPFSALALELTGTPDRQELTEQLESIQLDEAHGQMRAGSLVDNLGLTLEGLRAGSGEKGPAGEGYTFLPLTGLRLSSAVVPPWHGLFCRASLGSLGALGDQMGLSCKLLLAWDSKGVPSLWIALPKLFAVERVLNLSVGDARMSYDEVNSAYLLTLPEISLQCLGVLKLPPVGNLSCCVFGGEEVMEQGLGWYTMYQNPKGEH